MATLLPLRGIRYNPEHVRLGGVLAPPYDVIGPAQRDELYGRDLRNVVRIDFGKPLPGDAAGGSDVYIRAAEHLRSWLDLGILVRDPRPGLYLVSHEFLTPDGSAHRRLGLIGRVPAVPWERSEVRPHERTLRAPKEDRLALMRATRTQSSPVWVVWDTAPGLLPRLEELAQGQALIGGRLPGELGPEKLLLWQVQDGATLDALDRLLAPATLHIADGHHRFETAAAYAAERRQSGDGGDAESQFVLVYASAADDPALVVFPFHRTLRWRQQGTPPQLGGAPGTPSTGGDRPRPADEISDLLARLGAGWQLEPVVDPLTDGLSGLERRRAQSHAYVVVGRTAFAVLHRARGEAASARAALDVAVLQDQVLAPCGIGEAELREGALSYTRDPAEAVAAVREGRSELAFLLSPCTPAEVIAVAAGGETMPQKSTYFYPKVPTGLVISPV